MMRRNLQSHQQSVSSPVSIATEVACYFDLTIQLSATAMRLGKPSLPINALIKPLTWIGEEL